MCMIKVINKTQCCGCQACAENCPKSCISLYEDEEGFTYPMVDTTICINCHICEKVCPIINQGIEREPLAVYAAINKNDNIRLDSSSGGIFTLLAEKIIEQGGVVFGARWNTRWEVEHNYTETVEGLKQFRGSKYVQSNINGSYSKIETFLKGGREVLFSGTPCQIAGLRSYLRKDFDNLLLVECICHGVPSPAVFRQYLRELSEKINSNNKGERKWKENSIILTDVNFRDKRDGWNNYHCTFTFSSNEESIQYSFPSMQNVYFRGFNSDLYLRPSCHECQFRSLRSGSDITLGDFWGIDKVMPEFDDDKGVSAVIINTIKGKIIFDSLDIEAVKSSYDKICQFNHSIIKSDPPHPHRADFFLHDELSVHQRVYKYCWSSKNRLFLSRMRSLVEAVLHFRK